MSRNLQSTKKKFFLAKGKQLTARFELQLYSNEEKKFILESLSNRSIPGLDHEQSGRWGFAHGLSPKALPLLLPPSHVPAVQRVRVLARHPSRVRWVCADAERCPLCREQEVMPASTAPSFRGTQIRDGPAALGEPPAPSSTPAPSAGRHVSSGDF